MKIKNKIFFTFLITGIVLTLGGVTIFYFFTKNILIDEISEHLKILAASRASHIETFVEKNKEKIKLVSQKSIIKVFFNESNNEANKNQMIEIIKKVKENDPEIFKISILDKNGLIIASTDKSDIALNKSEILSVLNNKSIYIKNLHIAKSLKVPGLEIALPIITNGEILGAIMVDFDMTKLYEITTDHTGLGETGETYLVNKDGYMISPSRFKEDTFLNLKVETKNVQDCFEDYKKYDSKIHLERITIFSNYTGVTVLGTHAHVPEMEWCLLAEIEKKESFIFINKLIIFSIFLALFLIALIYIISNWVSNSISKPIKALHHGTEIIEQGNLNYKVSIDAKNEIGQLSRSFDKMTAAIKKSRAEVEEKVKKQTKKITEQNKNIEKQRQAILNVLEDVAQEKNEIAKERDKISTILRSIGDGVIVVDNQQKIKFLNPIAEELTGWVLKQAKNKDIKKIFNIYDEKTNSRKKSPIEEAFRLGKVAKLANHTVLKRKDGQVIPISDSAAPFSDKNNNIIGAILVFRDVIDERIAEQKIITAKNKLFNLNKNLDKKVDQKTKKLKDAFEELKSLDAMKDEVLNISAHELKTPLTSIIALSELIMLKKQGQINNQQKKSLNIIHEESNRLLNIIKKSLGITRIEADKVIFNLKPTNLWPIAESTIKSLKNLAEKQKVEIVCQKPNIPIIVNVDTERIQEVIYNLIDNAIKFSPPKSRIFVSEEIDKNNLIFNVKDQGPGIAKDKQKNLFKKFSQLDTGFSRKQEGTGLGLYISKIILDNMKGKIWVESEKNKGATFKFSLPIVKK